MSVEVTSFRLKVWVNESFINAHLIMCSDKNHSVLRDGWAHKQSTYPHKSLSRHRSFIQDKCNDITFLIFFIWEPFLMSVDLVLQKPCCVHWVGEKTSNVGGKIVEVRVISGKLEQLLFLGTGPIVSCFQRW